MAANWLALMAYTSSGAHLTLPLAMCAQYLQQQDPGILEGNACQAAPTCHVQGETGSRCGHWDT